LCAAERRILKESAVGPDGSVIVIAGIRNPSLVVTYDKNKARAVAVAVEQVATHIACPDSPGL